jgi:diacylglycerol kinase
MIIKKYLNSFSYALAGISYAFRSQFNMRFHSIAAVVVFLMSFLFQLSITEWCVIVFCIGSVIAAELINTSIESTVDLVSPGYHEKAGHAKDLASAAVLITCIMSAVIGSIVFIPKIIQHYGL